VSRAHATTDDRGAYRLEGAPSGAFTLMASKRGYRTVMTAGLHVEGGSTLTQDVTMNGSDGGGLELGGIGAALEQTGNGVMLRNVFPGDPADKAGLKSNDFVLRIDGESTDGMSMADVLQRLRGTPGTTVGVSVRRGGGDHETFDAVVVRATVVH
jgi:C-terminal processing protease CtpA/Prc